MNLESQVTSLELSKRLKELNIPQESLLSYIYYKGMTCDGWELKQTGWKLEDQEFICAFTAAELLQLLPYRIISKEPEPFNSYRLYISGSVIVKNPECIDPARIHLVNYHTDTYEAPHFLAKRLTSNIWDENPANALAKMLVYLQENNLI